jgi:endoglucanase
MAGLLGDIDPAMSIRRVALLSVFSLLVAACDSGSSSTRGSVAVPVTEDEDVAGWDSTPVEQFGQLQVDGTSLRSESGELVQLKGISSMWLNWENDGYAESKAALEWLRDNWHLSVIRASVGVEPGGAYLSNPERAQQQVDTIVQNAKDLGLYVIIDWHAHYATQHQEEAEEFFAKMAEKYGDLPNVLYEPFNEPKQGPAEGQNMPANQFWKDHLKPYYDAVLGKIREADPDNIVIFGTPNWSQDVDIAARSPVEGTNLMYTLHFYACTHGSGFISKGNAALTAGAALFVTEWGATHADGGTDGKVCEEEAQDWHDFMDEHAISWTAWKFDNCDGSKPVCDSSCLLKQGAPIDGPFTDEWLQGHATFVRDHMKPKKK